MSSSVKRKWILILILIFIGTQADFCQKKYFEEDSFVCVCDEEFCDKFPVINRPLTNDYAVLTSSRDEFRHTVSTGSIGTSNATFNGYAKIFINSSDMGQSMIGFGAAFTDSTGINILKLSEELQDTLLRQYFTSDGLEYNTGRVPIAGTDFSTRPYSYDDVDGDVELEYFNLTYEDYLYKIPFIKKAQEMSNKSIHLFASPWSPPSWMKSNGMFNGTGGLLSEMRQSWANYFVKFLDAYEDEGITFWGLTVQNEPSAGFDNHRWNACHFTGEEERDFVRDFLGPTLTAAGFRFLKLMIGDDGRHIYPKFIEKILNDEECSSFVDGIGVHWYYDDYTSPNILDQIHQEYPDFFLLYTEACTGYLTPFGDAINLGSWKRGEKYADHIIEDINHWSSGWTDWNMALDMNGGPNWASNFDESLIIVNEDSNEFYKQPLYYVVGHFSKLVPEGSIKIETSIEILNETILEDNNLKAVSFSDPDGFIISVVLNKNEESKTVALEDSEGNFIVHRLPSKSIQTFLYKKKLDSLV